MNKHSIILLAAVMAVSACTVAPDNDVKVTDDVNLVITAYQEGYSDTKTTVIDGGTLVYWESNDEVKVFYKTTGSRFTSTNTEPAGKADFTGNLTITGFFNEGFTADTPLWAVYPYRSDATSDGESVTTTLPAEQTGRAGSFAKSTFITLAKSANTQMGFYNVCGGVRFSLTHEGVKEVIFEGQNDEDIAGKVKLVFADGVPVVQEVIEGQKSVTLTAPGGGTFQTGQWYYIVALPGILSNGFKMTFNTETQYATLKSSGTKTIKRGIFGSLTDADEGLIYEDKGVGPTPEDVIQFEDVFAKYACVEKFDVNKDGEVSYAEAAAATTLNGLFTVDYKNVTSFDEIRFFTSVTSTQDVFTGLANLKHITIPDNITTLGTFQNCTALDTVKLPAALASLPTYCFDGCSSLKSVTMPAGITTIPNYAFRGCEVLTGIDLPSGVKTIGNYAFSGCSALTAVTLGNGVSVGQYAFSDCSSLTSVVLPEDMTTIPAYCFRNCYGLTNITWPSEPTTIGDGAFYGCQFKDSDYTLQLPASVTSIGSNAFGYFRHLIHLILPSTFPISIASDSFSESSLLYVPDSMLEMYKVRTNWNKYVNQIFPISQYPTEIKIEAIDLGLSVKWAPMNVGSFFPEGYGWYFAWGETEPKSNYAWSTYKYCNGSETTLTKYCYEPGYGYNGHTDSKRVLDLKDDAARANWGGSWRMPTFAEWRELINNCTWTLTTQNGVYGFKVTSKTNGNSIFLPAAGFRYESDLRNVGSNVYYWSSSLRTPSYAWTVELYSSEISIDTSDRCFGLSIRPVCE